MATSPPLQRILLSLLSLLRICEISTGDSLIIARVNNDALVANVGLISRCQGGKQIHITMYKNVLARKDQG